MKSNNGGNFVRREKELLDVIKGWNQHKIGKFRLQQNAKWTFNPMRSLGKVHMNSEKTDGCPPKRANP